MVDLIFTPVKKLSSSIWSNMADLIEKIDDMICSFEGGGEFTMDTMAMLVFGWLVLGLIVLAISKFVYARFFNKSTLKSETSIPKKVAAVAELAGVTANHTNDSLTENEAVKSDGSAVLSKMGSSRSGGKFVPPTPPLRKRLSTKKGSGPTPPGLRAHPVYTPPTVTGPDPESVRWVNEVFRWLYSNMDVVDELLDVWLQTLNEYTKKSVVEHGVGVEVVRILPETHPPSINNVFCECASNDDITITCDCEATPAIQLKAFRQRGEKVEVSHYRLNVNRFRARLNVACIPEKLLADVKCDGWPDIKVALAPVGSIKNNLDEQSLQDVIGDIVVTAMRNSVVPLNLYQYPSCPKFSRYVPTPGNVLPVHYDSLPEMMSRHPEGSFPNQKSGERRLLVKVIQAKDLGADCKEPYCVVEMDDPPQRNQTSVRKETNSPAWDEHFLFDLSSGTGELLFEVYDRTNKKFLGLGIVGMEELLVNPNQRQIISLQPRPYETENITGTLTVEFMFVDGNDTNALVGRPYKLKETLRSVTPSGNVITTSKTVFTADNFTNGGEGVTDSALKELELRNKVNSQPPASKSTLIIHSVQRQHANESELPSKIKVEQSKSGVWHEVSSENGQGTLDGSAQNDSQTEKAETAEGSRRLRMEMPWIYAALPPGLDKARRQRQTFNGRSRSRRRRRDFFGTIKRRFGKGRTRSKSLDPGERLDGADQLTRSVSADRMRDPSAHSTVPSLRVTDGELSRRSSVSDMSGLSGASARTFVNEASTLVLETIENGVKKHYLVPLSLAQKSKWRKKGTKLHIYNDHTFVAKHLSGSTTCQVCATLIPRRFGKQGYECRDCLLKCHKACHVKADLTCPQSTIQNIELSKILSSPLLDKKHLPPVSPRSKKMIKADNSSSSPLL